MKPRTDAMINGALIALGSLGILDNVVVHWLLEWHRAIPGPHALEVELVLVAGSTVLLISGGSVSITPERKRPQCPAVRVDVACGRTHFTLCRQALFVRY